jgi:hypothetical protein
LRLSGAGDPISVEPSGRFLSRQPGDLIVAEADSVNQEVGKFRREGFSGVNIASALWASPVLDA